MEARSFRVDVRRVCEGDTITQVVKGRIIRNFIEGITTKYVIVESDFMGCVTIDKQVLTKRLSNQDFAIEVGI